LNTRDCSCTLLAPLEWSGLISARPTIVLAGALLSFAAFLGATHALHALTASVTRDRRLARLSALLFALSPAGIFMSAVYTER
jgi:phosphatidylinositol glycan class V